MRQDILKIYLKYTDDEGAHHPGPAAGEQAGPADLRPGKTRSPRCTMASGVAIVSTPRGIMTDRKPATQNVGGELICDVW